MTDNLESRLQEFEDWLIDEISRWDQKMITEVAS